MNYSKLLCVAAALSAAAGEWSKPVEIRHDDALAMTYRAMYDGSNVIVAVKIEPGWHTFSMDNKTRQDAALKGKKSLGVEKPTTIEVAGLGLTGPWRQTEPKDFSKPELRWFSWGFEQSALFAAPAQPNGPGPAIVTVKGQACSDSVCKNVTVTLETPLTGPSPAVSLSGLTALQ
jgi:hypothetical protein